MDSLEENDINPNDLDKLCKTIEPLDKIHHIEIAKILKLSAIYLNENNNGIFVNLNKISLSTYNSILSYINFVKKQETHINKDEKLKKDLETIYFKDNKDNITNIVSNVVH